MLRNLAKQCTPALRVLPSASGSASKLSYTSSSLSRTFASSSYHLNSESDKSASTQALESQSSGQPTTDPTAAGSSNVSDALQRDLDSAADAEISASTNTTTTSTTTTTTSGRQAASTNLDDILGSVSAVSSSLPGDEATDAAAGVGAGGFREGRSPIVRGAAASRYAPSNSLFNTLSVAPHRLFVNSSRNNTILTLTSPSGDPLASASGGSVGFKKSARSGYEAGYRAAFSMFGKINEFKDAWRISHVEVLWNGFGQGREAVFRAMLAGEGQTTKGLISKMTDKTPVKIGGVRPKKRRML
ncbi:related to ribosomal protein YmS18, mitochondrial [Melanopsichium pennsylvanicum]|uniref:Related to ribosomal protein YmS18, mitochondrial n=2 Tax=Melanopsichium pennsylvanicum TaxID=63383 RepID=A0AAJ5C8M8_9BASI|nr:related to ribosomal protein YmS18, mitochondrial [Melanopsichium pennsylvanicum 4]SNX87733.1 related to ribosomal protein YmS18, mitochondrial [Melanopsichium pennsylvanicum]